MMDTGIWLWLYMILCLICSTTLNYSAAPGIISSPIGVKLIWGSKLRNKWGKNKALFKADFLLPWSLGMIAFCIGIWEKNLAIMALLVIFIKRMKKDGSSSATGVLGQQIERPPKTLIPIFEVQFQSLRLEQPFQNEGHKCICDLDYLSGCCQGNNWLLLNRTADFLCTIFPFCFGIFERQSLTEDKQTNKC